MRVRLQSATKFDAPSLVALRAAVNARMVSQFPGTVRPSTVTEKGVLFAMIRATVCVAKFRGQAVATLALSTRKPWAIDTAYFTPTAAPLYLTDMAVHPRLQRTGVGRQCIAQAMEIAKKWPATALRLDAYDTAYGAGDFYRKCGFHEVGRAIYRQVPLIYFELLLPLSGS